MTELLTEDHGAVRLLRLNRPTRLNALTFTMLEQFKATLLETRAAGFRAIVLTGSGRGFCTGAEMDESVHESRQFPEADGSPGGPPIPVAREILWVEMAHFVIHELHAMAIPSVAAINGTVAGGGFDLALACDFRIAAASVKFHPAMRNLGLAPDLGASWLLTRAVGIERAKHFYLLDKYWTAQDALAYGAISEVADDDVLEDLALAKAQALAALPALTVAATKRLIDFNTSATLGQAQAFEAEMAHMLGQSPDGAESIEAFFGKREARFRHGW